MSPLISPYVIAQCIDKIYEDRAYQLLKLIHLMHVEGCAYVWLQSISPLERPQNLKGFIGSSSILLALKSSGHRCKSLASIVSTAYQGGMKLEGLELLPRFNMEATLINILKFFVATLEAEQTWEIG